MDANCIHGVVWFECKKCDEEVNLDPELEQALVEDNYLSDPE